MAEIRKPRPLPVIGARPEIVPCITLREETEWVETVSTGWNTLVGADSEAFAAALVRPLPHERPPVFGDGHAAERIAQLCAEHLSGKGRAQAVGEASVA